MEWKTDFSFALSGVFFQIRRHEHKQESHNNNNNFKNWINSTFLAKWKLFSTNAEWQRLRAVEGVRAKRIITFLYINVHNTYKYCSFRLLHIWAMLDFDFEIQLWIHGVHKTQTYLLLVLRALYLTLQMKKREREISAVLRLD